MSRKQAYGNVDYEQVGIISWICHANTVRHKDVLDSQIWSSAASLQAPPPGAHG
jgi:hypothetical protein